MNTNIILTCKKTTFYSQLDEDAFFKWIKKIKCIKNIEEKGDELYLSVPPILSDTELRNILALFYRYKIDMKQLAIFLKNSNRTWFFEGHKGYWYDNVFGT